SFSVFPLSTKRILMLLSVLVPLLKYKRKLRLGARLC
ncbi:MAG: hypothetical protein ACI9B9_002127, partial [Halioglobus sp.]